ncbi:unnamed protein product [Adineta steineri]|uniref:NAD(P)(+)--arginine ADP-ribosyltransferase n=2 Tax=Adineta steineri TaxID=433720 RepID=A0A820BA36_9BILA|nr:unnamed protein product [Adineta steineri]
MASAACCRAPILRRPSSHYQWYWNYRQDDGKEEEWMKYINIDNEIIEDAYNEQKDEVEIDGSIMINLKQQIQYQKVDLSEQCVIKRVLLEERVGRNVHLQEERFSQTIVVSTTTSIDGQRDLPRRDADTHAASIEKYDLFSNDVQTSHMTRSLHWIFSSVLGNKPATESENKNKERNDAIEHAIQKVLSVDKTQTGMQWMRSGYFSSGYELSELRSKNKTIANVVQEAAEGILKEGEAVGKLCQAQHLAQQLMKVKHYGEDIQVKYFKGIQCPSEIGDTFVNVYTKDSFWYKLLNGVLRHPKTASYDQLKTLGPFCFLLHNYLKNISTTDILRVYRGILLTTAEERKSFMDKHVRFLSFNSTTANRELAEIYGNTLLIIDLDTKFNAMQDCQVGASISHLSNFPEEEEYLLWTGACFEFVKYEYDNLKHKHIIYLKSSEANNNLFS